MTAILRAKDLDRGLALRQRGDEIGLGDPPVVLEMPRAYAPPAADAGVDDDPIETAEILRATAKSTEHLGVVVDVQGTHAYAQARLLREQFGAQRLEALTATGAQGKIATARGELPCHARTQSGARARDEYALSHVLPISGLDDAKQRRAS
jgi:hypothetical protein